jgi:hypothetical protein
MEAERFEFRITSITGSVDSVIAKNSLRYKGRNGWGICNGVALRTTGSIVSMLPYNSKGAISDSCQIDLPDNPLVLRKLGQVLIDRAKLLETVGGNGKW